MHLFYAKRHPPAFTGGCLRISGCALQSLLDLGCDLVGGEAVLPQHILGLAGLAEAVVDADLAEFTGKKLKEWQLFLICPDTKKAILRGRL